MSHSLLLPQIRRFLRLCVILAKKIVKKVKFSLTFCDLPMDILFFL